MPATRTTSAARLRITIRRVRLDVAARRTPSSTRRTGRSNCPLARSGPGMMDGLPEAFSLRLVSATIRSVGPLAFAEPVPHAVERFDHVEIVVHGFELLAQPLDMAV